jgi:hypothetical protein
MMTARRQAPDSARVTRSGATRAREPRGGLAAAARGIATKAASALRAVRTGLGRGARCVAPPSRAPSPAEEAPDWPAGQAAQAGAEQAPSGVLLRLLPPPALLAAALQPFEFHGMLCAMTSPEEGLYIKPSEASTATSVLDLCAAWLRVPAETITVRGARRTLSAASPGRTIAEAGLPRQLPGSPPAVALRVTAVPWCCICLQPVRRGRVWSCDAAQHSCCHACARQFAETSATLRPSLALSWLRCPAPGCTASLAHGAALHKLLSYKAMDRLRAQRAAGQAKRLNSVRAGKEVRLLLQHASHRHENIKLLTQHRAGCGSRGDAAQRRCQSLPHLLSADRERRRLQPRVLQRVRRLLRLVMRVVANSYRLQKDCPWYCAPLHAPCAVLRRRRRRRAAHADVRGALDDARAGGAGCFAGCCTTAGAGTSAADCAGCRRRGC